MASCSLANALTVRMPETPASTAVLISAVSRFTSRLRARSRSRSRITTASSTGSRRSKISASSQRIVARMTIAPAIVSDAWITVSGPWWASSVMSKRSVVMRDMSLPVRCLSKKANESVCTLAKMSSRMSASTRTPSSWPYTVTIYCASARSRYAPRSPAISRKKAL